MIMHPMLSRAAVMHHGSPALPDNRTRSTHAESMPRELDDTRPHDFVPVLVSSVGQEEMRELRHGVRPARHTDQSHERHRTGGGRKARPQVRSRL